MIGRLIKNSLGRNRKNGALHARSSLFNTCVQASSFEYHLVDQVVAKVLEMIRPDARGVTTHAVGLNGRVEALLRLLSQARPSRLSVSKSSLVRPGCLILCKPVLKVSKTMQQ